MSFMKPLVDSEHEQENGYPTFFDTPHLLKTIEDHANAIGKFEYVQDKSVQIF